MLSDQVKPEFCWFRLFQLSLLRLGSWLGNVVATKVMQGAASTLSSSFDPSVVTVLIGVGLFTWGAVNFNKEEEAS